MVYLQCKLQYFNFVTFSLFLFLCISQGFFPLFSISRFPGTWKWVHCFLWTGCDWFILITILPTPLYLYGAVTEDTGELYIHKSKEMLYFVLCLFASNSQLCIYWVDATEYGEEKPHNHYVVAPTPGCNTVIQNKCFPSLWKHDYIWLICLCASFSELNPNMAERGCAKFHACWLQLTSCWEGDTGQAVTMGPCELPNNICYILLTGLHSWQNY